MPIWMAKSGCALLLASFVFVVGCSQNSPVGFEGGDRGLLDLPIVGGTPPLAIPDVFTLLSDSADNSLDVLANDIDNSGGGLSLSNAAIALSVPPSNDHVLEIDPDQGGLNFTPAAGFIGVVTVNYTALDANNAGAIGIATITVLPIAPPPVTVPDVFTVQTDGPQSRFPVTLNDLDFSGAGLTLTDVSPLLTIPPAAAGNLSIDGNDVLYTPAPGFIGVETLEYTVEDGNGNSLVGLITVTVLPITAPPVAVPDVVTVNSGAGASLIDVLDNDVDLSGTGLTLTDVVTTVSVPPAGGEVLQIVGDQVEYTPPAGFAGLQTITYTVEDGLGNSSSGTLLATVIPSLANPPPVVVPDVVTAQSNSADNVIAVLGNDIDVAGGGLSIINASITATVPDQPGGTVSASPDGSTLIYTPPAGFTGVQTLSYAVEDANGSTATGLVTVTVLPIPIELPPVAAPDIATVTQNSGVNAIDVLANDLDASSSGLTINSVSVASSVPAGDAGTVSTDGNTVSYTPPAGFQGVQLLNYEVIDGNGTTATSVATVVVSPIPLDLPPVAVPDIATVDQGSAGNTIAVLDNDLDSAGGGLTLESANLGISVPNAAGETISVVGNEVVYTPPAGFAGVQTINYNITDSNGTAASGVLTVTVVPAINGVPPVAIPDVAVVDQDSTNTLIDVLGNDLDSSGTGLSLVNVSVASSVPPAGGDVTGIQGDQVIYSPPAGFAGVQIINYTIEDGNGATSTGALTVTVTPTNPLGAPVALPDVLTVNQDSNNNALDVLANDLDISGTGLTLTGAADAGNVPPTGGSVIAVGAGQVLYTPPAGFVGVQTISYSIEDGAGSTSSGLATVTVTPGAAAAPPVAIPDVATVSQDSANNVIDVLSNDVDIAAGGLTLISVNLQSSAPPAGGDITGPAANQVNYTPPAGFAGVQIFNYSVEDANGATATGLLTITVTPNPAPNAPVPIADAFVATQDSNNNSFDVLSNDLDISGTGLTLTSAALAQSIPENNAATVGVSGGQLSYSPPAGFAGVQIVSYVVTDGNGETGSGLATITVTPAAPAVPPVATPDIATVNQGSSNNLIDVLANDASATGGALTLVSAALATSVPAAAGETIVLSGNQVDYTPPAGFSGIQLIQYVVEDDQGQQSTGLATVTVSPLGADPAPVAIPDAFTVNQGSSNNDFAVLDNDVDLAGNGISVTATAITTSLPPGNPGSVSINGDNVRYTPAANFTGIELVSYTITAADGQTSDGLITVTVSPAALAPPPLAVPDAFSVVQDSANNSFAVLGNDVANAPGDLTLTLASLTQSVPPAAGETVATAGDNVIYTPPAGFSGLQTLSYTVENSNGATTDGVITVTVTPATPAPNPVALPDTATVNQDSVNNLLDFVANDVDPAGGGLTLSNLSITNSAPASAGGTVFVSGNQAAYSPPAGYSGVQTLEYLITDTNGNTATGAALVTVVPAALSPSPVAAPDIANVQQDSVNNTISVLNNDVDTSGTGLTLTAVELTTSVPPNNGQTLAISGDDVLYTPEAGFAGSQVLTYTITDGNGATAQGQIVVSVSALPLPVPPIPLADLVTVSPGSANNPLSVLGNDIGPGLTITNVSPVGGASGTMNISGDGSQLIYSPPGGAGVGTVELFEYSVEDDQGTAGAASATVTILILL